jgi:hypothetical protein
LKIVSGEAVPTKPVASETTPSTSPVPTCAAAQIRRASSVVAWAISSGAQVGRPRTLSRPSWSKSTISWRSAVGRLPSLLVMLA